MRSFVIGLVLLFAVFTFLGALDQGTSGTASQASTSTPALQQ